LILKIKRQHVNLLKEEAEKVSPVEACALLFGRTTRKETVVKKVVVVPNRLKSTVCFKIDPEIFAKAFTKANKEGLDFIGFFHSHPAPTKPSPLDLKYMKLWGDATWLILSLTNGDLAAYQMINGKVKKVTIKVE
jgi:proteasome lid subunit RPN8/RPN11